MKVSSSCVLFLILCSFGCNLEGPSAEEYVGSYTGVYDENYTYNDPERMPSMSRTMQTVTVEKESDGRVIITEINGCKVPGAIQIDGSIVLDTTECTPESGPNRLLVITGTADLKNSGSLELTMLTNFNEFQGEDETTTISGQTETSFLGTPD